MQQALMGLVRSCESLPSAVDENVCDFEVSTNWWLRERAAISGDAVSVRQPATFARALNDIQFASQ
jgi:hypothetical protein